MRRDGNFLAKGISVLLALALWQITADMIGMEILLASPISVAARLCALLPTADFFLTVLFSVLRILGGFFLASVSAVLLALLSCRFPIAETLLWPYVTAVRAVPVASFVVISLIWFSIDQFTVFIAFLISFPVLYQNTLEGLKNTSPDMLELASLYRVPWRRKLLYLYLPQVRPYFLSACSISQGMAWKAGVAAEMIGVVSGSIGEKLYEAKVHFLTADLLAWTVVIILLSVLFGKILDFLLSRIFGRLEKL